MKCPECQNDMITAKNGHMCLNCGYAESADPHTTPLVPGDSPAPQLVPQADPVIAAVVTDDSVTTVITPDEPVATPAEPVAPIATVTEPAKEEAEVAPEVEEPKPEVAVVVPSADSSANSLEDQVKLDMAEAVAAVEQTVEPTKPDVVTPDVTAEVKPDVSVEPVAEVAPAEATAPVISASEIIKTKGMSKPEDKTVDRVTPRGRTKGTLDLKPSRDDLVKGAASVSVVDAIGPALAAPDKVVEAEVPETVTVPSEPEPTPEVSEPIAPVETESSVPDAIVEPEPVKADEDATPLHVIDHTAEAEAVVVKPELTTGITPEPASEPAVESVAEPVVEVAAEPVIEPATEPVVDPVPVPEVTAPVVETPAEPAPEPLPEPTPEPTPEPIPELTPDPAPAPAAEVPQVIETPVPSLPVSVATEAPVPLAEPVIASVAPTPAPVKEPLVAMTHPEAASAKTVMTIVSALVIVTFATVAAFYFTSSKSAKKVGQNASASQESSVATANNSAAVLDASATPAPTATPEASSAADRDAKRKGDLAAYAATIKAVGSNGFYPTAAPAISATLVDPTTAATYVVGTTPAASAGQIQYLAGGKCGAPSVTPGKTSTRYISLSTKLETDSTPYCINVK